MYIKHIPLINRSTFSSGSPGWFRPSPLLIGIFRQDTPTARSRYRDSWGIHGGMLYSISRLEAVASRLETLPWNKT